MINKEILLVADAVSNEKDVPKEMIFEAIEIALATATKKRYDENVAIRVSIDRNTGDYQTYRYWEVIADDAELESPESQYPLQQALKLQPDIAVGEYIEEPIDSIEFGRIAAQAAKQVIVQKIREAERMQVVNAYQNRIGSLVMGVVKRMERGNIFLDLGDNAEAFISKDQMLPREVVRNGDRLRGYLLDVKAEARGPQLHVSRTCPEFLIELFKIEVPEVGQGLIEILGAARDPGIRAKITVKSNDPKLDPVGACVGMRGSRVQAVSNELAGERVDIILWDENPAQFVINAMSPAEVLSIVIDEDSHSMDLAVRAEKLSQAIGRSGQNVRLASELTGWTLNVMDEKQAEEKGEAEAQALLQTFMEQLDVDADVATILVQEGFANIEDVAYISAEEMQKIEEFDEEISEELRNRARDALLAKAITGNDAATAENIRQLPGMTEAIANSLAAQGITSLDELGEQSIDELMEIEGMDPAQAADWIMLVRESWFAEETEN